MRNVVFAPETINLAETTRMIEVAKACHSSFHPVFFGYGGPFADLITQAGFEFHLLEPRLTPEKAEHLYQVDRMEKLADPFTEAELRKRVESELALYGAVNPAAVVIGFTLSTTISARVAGVPLVFILPFAWTRPFTEAGLLTWPDIWDYAILRPIPRKLLNQLVRTWYLQANMWTGTFQKVSRHFNGPPIRRTLELFEGDYNLVTEIPELIGLPDLPPNWQYIGPIFAHLQGEVPEAVRQAAARHPSVYCAMGSSANRDILKVVLESFADTPYSVIAPVEAHVRNMSIATPPNVLVCDWLPAHKVNPLVDMAVIHGGQGTVQTACASGTPFVGIGLQPEQEANIEWMARFGCAIRLRRRRLSRLALIEAMDRLIHDETAKHKAKEVQALIRKWDGAANAARFLAARFGNGEVA